MKKDRSGQTGTVFSFPDILSGPGLLALSFAEGPGPSLLV